jgi:hypothetical protein
VVIEEEFHPESLVKLSPSASPSPLARIGEAQGLKRRCLIITEWHGQRMTGYYIFYAHLILAIFSIVVTAIAIIKRNYETFGPILFLCSLIGLSCNYFAWVRTFSGIYHIVWFG